MSDTPIADAVRKSFDYWISALEDEQRRLDEAGIIHSVRTTADLDEAPGAYKPIEVVMAQQADLTTPYMKLRPLAVVKG